LIITFLIAISISILDYLIPILGVKKLGGTKGGQIGASLGVIIGLFFLGPLGLIAGPFIGSLTGEFISKKNLKDLKHHKKDLNGELIFKVNMKGF
jgi:uncharacterized protein YqgC (DUF456 family)